MYDTHNYCISFATRQVSRSLNILSFKLFTQRLQKLGGKECAQIGHSFSQIFWKIDLWRSSSMITLFTHQSELNKEHVLWKFQVIQTTFSEVREHVLWKCQVIRTTFAEERESKTPKIDKNVLKPAILILLLPEISKDILNILFF